jgi:hypothetical protein
MMQAATAISGQLGCFIPLNALIDLLAINDVHFALFDALHDRIANRNHDLLSKHAVKPVSLVS